jgi:hypothetical protein
MSEKIVQIVKAVSSDNDGNEYRVVGTTSESGFFAYIEYRPEEENGIGVIGGAWDIEPYHNQYQVWESDTPDFMKPVDLLTDSHLREWFEGQGYTLGDKPLSICCGGDYIWLNCDECAESDEPHSYAVCEFCGADIDD